MSRTIMLIPTSNNVGLTSVILGITKALLRQRIPFGVFKPIEQFCTNNSPNQISEVVYRSSSIPISKPFPIEYVESLLSTNQQNFLLEEIITRYYENSKDTQVVLVEGLIPTQQHQLSSFLNYEIAKTLNAEIVFLITLTKNSLDQIKNRIKLLQSRFGGSKNKKIIGIIINKFNAPIDASDRICINFLEIFGSFSKTHISNIDPEQLLTSSPLPVLGCIPWNFDLIVVRATDICHYLNAHIINKGNMQTCLITSVIFCIHSLPNILKSFHSGTLLVIPSDYQDILIAACLSAKNGSKIGAILLTGEYRIDDCVYKLCESAFQTGIPVFSINANIWQTLLKLQNFNLQIPFGDVQHCKKVQEYVADHINNDWIKSLTITSDYNNLLSPAAFCYQITQLARKAYKRILLPEGSELRIIKAAAICSKRGVAKCILLGNPNKIRSIAEMQGIIIDKDIEIIDPEKIRKNYTARLIELRQDKGIIKEVAEKQLEDNMVLGTMMLESGEVDGLVSGVAHTTANTIRPPLQLIKTAKNNSIISSVFFMLFPDQVLIYGDCAINPNPNAKQLAEIAIQSARSAAAFGIDPRIAMISYSTGNSGTGRDVEKVREATHIVQKNRPDLIIDGPMQYDTAIIEEVAKIKAPNSKVAGRATVFIFPDLNTGNTTYKAVQRSTNLISIGPMLQGIRKPVNDLSRGATVDDIVYTIIITAVQALKML